MQALLADEKNAMPDQFSPVERSRIMRLVKSADTTPELVVRKLVHSMGFRFRLHVQGLPGRPDLVFSRLGKVMLVHGCFWHRHSCRNGQSLPATRKSYWERKFTRTIARDRSNIRKLRQAGWSVLVVWECQTRPAKLTPLRKRLSKFLAG